MCIVITTSSIVQYVPDDDFTIPRHKFEFTKLDELFKIPRDYTNFNTIGTFPVFLFN